MHSRSPAGPPGPSPSSPSRCSPAPAVGTAGGARRRWPSCRSSTTSVRLTSRIKAPSRARGQTLIAILPLLAPFSPSPFCHRTAVAIDARTRGQLPPRASPACPVDARSPLTSSAPRNRAGNDRAEGTVTFPQSASPPLADEIPPPHASIEPALLAYRLTVSAAVFPNCSPSLPVTVE